MTQAYQILTKAGNSATDTSIGAGPGTDGQTLLCMVCRNDDFKAFELLFHRYRPYLCKYVYSIICCEHKAEEVVSDVFLKLWNNRKNLRIDSSLKAYLKISVRNQSIDYLRKQIKLKRIEETVRNKDDEFQPCPESQMILRELEDHVELVIRQLPPKGQHIFRLSRYNGLKYKEIAQHLNISIKTVETHMRRSLIRLRQELKPYLND